MNFATVGGFLLGLVLVVLAVMHSTDKPSIYIDVAGILLVMGGLVAAALVSFPMAELKRLAKVIGIIMTRERLDVTSTILRIQQLATVVSREGLDALDAHMGKIEPPFLRDGLEMVVDQVHPDEIMAVLERRIELTYERELVEAKILRTLGKMAPSFGMLGTTVGLVNMMSNLDFSGFEKVGAGFATALATTFYGLILAYLVFAPLANRLEARAEERVLEMRLIAEGVILIARRVPASLVLHRLQAYVPPRMWTASEGQGRSGMKRASGY